MLDRGPRVRGPSELGDFAINYKGREQREAETADHFSAPSVGGRGEHQSFPRRSAGSRSSASASSLGSVNFNPKA